MVNGTVAYIVHVQYTVVLGSTDGAASRERGAADDGAPVPRGQRRTLQSLDTGDSLCPAIEGAYDRMYSTKHMYHT